MTRLLLAIDEPLHPAVTTLASQQKLANSETHVDRAQAATRHVGGNRRAFVKRRAQTGVSVVRMHRIAAELPTPRTSDPAADGRPSI